MIEWMKRINWGKVVLSGFIYTLIATVVHQIEAALTMNYYLDPTYFGLWSKLMMPIAGPPPMSFFITSLVMTFVSGVSLAIVYYYLRDRLPQEPKKRVIYFTDLTVGLGFIFFTLPVYLMFNVPLGLLIAWFISSFIILFASSAVFVKINK